MIESLITSKTRIKLLLKFFFNSQTKSYLRSLEKEFGESSNAIRIELNRFEEAGMLKSEYVGNRKFFQANTEHSLYNDVNNILKKFIGIDKIIDRITSQIGDLETRSIINPAIPTISQFYNFTVLHFIMLNTAIKAAIKAGHEILKIYNDPEADFLVERKADDSPLTIADKTSHQVINQLLKTTGLPVLSEEGRDITYAERKNWKTFWMVDPLDGTKEFIKRNGEFTVNIALITKNQPVMGVIYVPVTRVLYVGDIQQGTWKLEKTPVDASFEAVKKAGTRLPVTIQNSGYTIVGSRSHANNETREYIEQRKKEHPQIDIISKGSSLKICMVAEGIADEYPRFGPTMEWDTAAGHAIANASGKKLWLTNLEKELSYNKKNLLNPYFIVK